jgi:GST-like protein
LSGREFIAGSDYTIVDMAAYPWVVPWKRQQQDLDDFPYLRGWFDAVRARPATIRAYAAGEPYSNRAAVNEEARKFCLDRQRRHRSSHN